MVSAPSSMTVPIPSLRATFFAPPSGTNPPMAVRRSAEVLGTTMTHLLPVSAAVCANALAVFPAEARIIVPPPLSLRRAYVGYASISLNVHDLTRPPLSG